MSEIRAKCFKTIEDAKKNARSNEQIFKCSDPGVPGRVVYVSARTHPLARAAAALYWQITCSTVSEAKAVGPRDIEEAAEGMSIQQIEQMEAQLAELKARKQPKPEPTPTTAEPAAAAAVAEPTTAEPAAVPAELLEVQQATAEIEAMHEAAQADDSATAVVEPKSEISGHEGEVKEETQEQKQRRKNNSRARKVS